MAVVSDFREVFNSAVKRFYDSATEPNNEWLKDLLECENEDDAEEVFDNVYYSDELQERLDNALDDVLMYYSNLWAVIIEYTNPTDIINNGFDGLDVYDEFKYDVFKEVKQMVTDNFDELKQLALENKE